MSLHNDLSSQRRNGIVKACTNCARVKCKCQPRGSGQSCERCHRLDKECVFSNMPAQPRGPKRGSTSRSARVEQKLDDLVAALGARQMLPASMATPDYGPVDNARATTSEPPNEPFSPSTSHASVASSGDQNGYFAEVSPSEADECLSRFREDMIVFTPYVYIPPDTSASRLRQTYPFLWWNIVAITSSSVKTRNELSLQTRHMIIERVVAGGERSLDLLLGILTFVNWVHLSPLDKEFASLASQLAVSIVWDLGLHLPLSQQRPTWVYANPTPSSPAESQPVRDHTIEEQRAVLGTFVISSTLSHTLNSANGFRWSSHMDDYLANIENHSSLQQDNVLVKQVKLQLIVSRQFLESSTNAQDRHVPHGWVDALQRQIQEITIGVDQRRLVFGNETALAAFGHYATLVIHDVATLKPLIARNEPDSRRYEIYQRCLESTKSWLDFFFSMPLHMFPRVPYIMLSHLCFVVKFLPRLTMGEGDATWSTTLARKVVDPLRTLDRIIYIFEQIEVAAMAGCPLGDESHALLIGVRKFRAFRSSWHDELTNEGKTSKTALTTATGGPANPDTAPFASDFYPPPPARSTFRWLSGSR